MFLVILENPAKRRHGDRAGYGMRRLAGKPQLAKKSHPAIFP
jgi:hypothetical protein